MISLTSHSQSFPAHSFICFHFLSNGCGSKAELITTKCPVCQVHVVTILDGLVCRILLLGYVESKVCVGNYSFSYLVLKQVFGCVTLKNLSNTITRLDGQLVS